MKKPSFPPPAPICVPCRLAAIGAVVVAMAGGFAYVAGWLTPQRLTTHRIINAFEADNGSHPGFRRNHAKGVCVSGYFDSNGNAAALSRAGVFARGRTPVIGRFAIPGGNPSAPDTSVPVRSMALMFTLHDGEQWRTGMNSVPVFPVVHLNNSISNWSQQNPIMRRANRTRRRSRRFLRPIRKPSHFRHG